MSPEEGSPEPSHERPLRRPFRVLCGAGPLRGVCCAYTARLGIGLPCGNLPMRHRAAFSRAVRRPLVAACAAAQLAQRSPSGAGDVLFRRLLVVFDLTDTKKPVIGLATQNPQYTPVSQASQRNINRSRAGCRRRCRLGSCGSVACRALRVACRASCKGEREMRLAQRACRWTCQHRQEAACPQGPEQERDSAEGRWSAPRANI